MFPRDRRARFGEERRCGVQRGMGSMEFQKGLLFSAGVWVCIQMTGRRLLMVLGWDMEKTESSGIADSPFQ